MKQRRRSLPRGWYPESASEVARTIEGWEKSLEPTAGGCEAGIVPHAGWEFSGRLAYEVLRKIDRDVETVAIIGGHLPETGMVLAAPETSCETPMGALEIDVDIAGDIEGRLSPREDSHADNTVEVQLPILKYLLPRVRILHLRVSPTREAVTLGEVLAESAERLGRKLVAIGSTDLTHYGPNYGFAPKGQGAEAVAWVRDTNDRRFIDRALGMDTEAVLEVAARERSACSAGGAVAAIAYATRVGATEAELADYRLSYDIHPSSSFVGYAAITYRRPR